MVNNADVIFGCSGEDILKGIRVDNLSGEKDLVSVSSEDIEFKFILRHDKRFFSVEQKKDYLEYKSEYTKLKLWKNGYPINFDNSKFSVVNEKISLTRGLLFSAVIQLLEMFSSNNHYSGFLELDKKLSSKVLRLWKESNEQD